MMKSFFFFF